MTNFDNAAHLQMHQAVKAFKSGDRERLGAIVMRLLASGDLDIDMVGLAADGLNEAQFESFQSFLRGFVCENRMTTGGGQTFDFGVFAIPYESEEPFGPFLSDTLRDGLLGAMRSCGLFDADSQVFLMERILNPIDVIRISESAIFEYGVNSALMVSSDMQEDAQLAAVDLVSDLDPFPPVPMTTGIILGVRVLKTKPDAPKTIDRVFFAADYELDDQDIPWNGQWAGAMAGLRSARGIGFARPRPWTWAPRPRVELVDEEPDTDEDDPSMRLVRAALPFATAGLRALDVRPDENGGWFWAGKEQNASIRTWFGPSDFGNLLEALEELGVRIIDEEED